jgi:hypothetical protein
MSEKNIKNPEDTSNVPLYEEALKYTDELIQEIIADREKENN